MTRYLVRFHLILLESNHFFLLVFQPLSFFISFIPFCSLTNMTSQCYIKLIIFGYYYTNGNGLFKLNLFLELIEFLLEGSVSAHYRIETLLMSYTEALDMNHEWPFLFAILISFLGKSFYSKFCFFVSSLSCNYIYIFISSQLPTTFQPTLLLITLTSTFEYYFI